jgi:chorismate mutase/GNAT superfamily N-acetyltransferase
VSSTEAVPPSDVTLRPATEDDAEPIARVHVETRRAAVPAMPPGIHSDDETRAWIRARLREGGFWVAVVDGAVVGYARISDGWLDDLYVLPAFAGQGIGTALLAVAKGMCPSGFALWVFESNEPARRFYRRHGLLEIERTDGRGNEERSPDIRMAWPGRDPLEYLRAMVDEVDDELAVLLARRAALTAAVQQVKEVPGHEGRDPDREAEIAHRMAERAPGLGEDRLRRIMHEVISVSLDAATRPDDEHASSA